MPMLLAYHTSRVLPFGSKFKSDMKELKEAIDKCEEIGDAFEYFTSNQWIFENARATQLFRSLSPEDRKIFNYDVHRVQWEPYIMNFAYGIKRFILKEEAELPSVGYNDAIMYMASKTGANISPFH